MNESGLPEYFPNLKIGSYSITSPRDIGYNCIAWAMNNNSKWWWPDSNNQYYWPEKIPREETLDAFIAAFNMLGYFVCDNQTQEIGFEKIAIYVNMNGKPTHGARQLGNGKWTSKLGSLEDIEHDDLEGLTGPSYGSTAVIMKRKI